MITQQWLKWTLPVIALAIGAAGMAAISASAEKESSKEEIDTRPTVSTMVLNAEDHVVQLSSFGEVKPVERTQLAAQVSGEVLSWNPKLIPGGLVKRGELLFTLEKENYQAALLQAEANVSRAQANLIEEQAKAQVAQQEAKRIGKQVSALYLREPQVLSAQAELKSAQAALQRAKRELADCDVKAPYDALVISRELGVGQFINKGAQIAELYNIEAAEITLPIPGFEQHFLPEQLAGLDARITLRGQPEVARSAQLHHDLGIVDNATRMSHLVVRIEDPYSLNSDQPILKFGSYAQVQFQGITLKQVFKLPQSLVTNNRVWLINAEQKLEPRDVEVIREEGEYFLIRSGLSEQDTIVTTVPDYPQKGMAVKTIAPQAQLALSTLK